MRCQRDIHTIRGITRYNDEPARWVKRDANRATCQHSGRRAVLVDLIETTGTGKRLDNIQTTVRIKCESLRTPKT